MEPIVALAMFLIFILRVVAAVSSAQHAAEERRRATEAAAHLDAQRRRLAEARQAALLRQREAARRAARASDKLVASWVTARLPRIRLIAPPPSSGEDPGVLGSWRAEVPTVPFAPEPEVQAPEPAPDPKNDLDHTLVPTL